MTTDDIKAALERAEKGTTEGPWHDDQEDKWEQVQVTGGNGRLVCVCAHECVTGLIPEMKANAAFIAAARTDVPRLARALLVALAALQQTKADCQAQRERGEVDIRGPIYSLNQALKEISAL